MFGINSQAHTGQFTQGSRFEEVVGAARREYPSCDGNAKGVEHFL